jgi:hypothetical protein
VALTLVLRTGGLLHMQVIQANHIALNKTNVCTDVVRTVNTVNLGLARLFVKIILTNLALARDTMYLGLVRLFDNIVSTNLALARVIIDLRLTRLFDKIISTDLALARDTVDSRMYFHHTLHRLMSLEVVNFIVVSPQGIFGC